ncbi:AraC family transcriptional regulator [uncultured Chitinophaga sp.]|uniref:helix-turn-helix domain-containing protein n=1 Tax=uncultured Chitinophaga sp. TaxID=339340 RepID=UPI0025F3998D|nr:AraC family transcriptional regulator [uncultured Chitinophaga sp.]
MNFHFPENPEVKVIPHPAPHLFDGLFKYCDVIEHRGAFGEIYQQTDTGIRNEATLHHFKFGSSANAYLNLDEPAIYLSYINEGRLDARHEHLGELWQSFRTCSLWYLPAGQHIFEIGSGNCISVKVKVSLQSIKELAKNHPELHEFYERATTLNPEGWRLPYLAIGQKTRTLLRRLNNLTQIGPTRQISLDALLDELLLQFIQDLDKTKTSGNDTYQYNEEDIEAILNARDEILHRKYHNIPIPALALQFGMPYRKFSRYCKKVLHITVADEIRLKKIQSACELLVKTDNSINLIADEVGYENHSAFTRAFSKTMGCTPSAYRRHHRESNRIKHDADT